MQIEVRTDNSCTEPKVVIWTASMTEEVHRILDALSDHAPQVIPGMRDNKIEVIEPTDLIRIYADAGKVFAETHKGKYALRLRLYEIEKRTPAHRFVRISNSEIINLNKVSSFDLSFTGAVCVKLANGTTTYVSRRYVSKLKKILGI